ncbi:MAG: redox-regulated ATPase YchF [Chloroflexi bacterium]|nr:redox-regulated ATPase YchF [Chloroflexota bacterium]
MQIALVGLPRSGRTTVFNALTRGHAETALFSTGGEQPNVGVAKVPEERLPFLAELFRPKRVVPAEVQYMDMPESREEGKGHGIGGQYLNILQQCDALLHVVRAFRDPGVPHEEGSVDPYRDVESMDLELAFSDLAILERRVQRLEVGLKGAKPSQRDAVLREKEALTPIKAALEKDTPIREQRIPPDLTTTLENYQFLTAKPLLVVFNIGEEDLARAGELEEEMRQRLSRPGVAGAALCGKLEMELAQMSPEEEAEFRRSLGLGQSGLERIIRISYDLMGLISFFTGGDQEVHAWTIARGTVGQKAAGKVHSDMERGFIRAEVVAYDDLHRCGSLAEARKQGLLRLEGKTYEVRDGDVIKFLFNV